MLSDPNYGNWTMSSIALEAGIGDLSHFNRSFKSRFGAITSEVRQRSRMR
ncbi:AraC family transcriptional regulator [Hyphomicrobium sp. xq]|uniref:AraC family transcriptional regulator n=1 Tax=Hyphomicrobium album TaxID=2665159 RepID=A0A6I3KJ03_9HYPH|nr:AraC family transcriptional regulator [Hyphomicrobium album]